MSVMWCTPLVLCRTLYVLVSITKQVTLVSLAVTLMPSSKESGSATSPWFSMGCVVSKFCSFMCFRFYGLVYVAKLSFFCGGTSPVCIFCVILNRKMQNVVSRMRKYTFV